MNNIEEKQPEIEPCIREEDLYGNYYYVSMPLIAQQEMPETETKEKSQSLIVWGWTESDY